MDAAEELLRDVKVFPSAEQYGGKRFEIHPRAVITEDEIIGEMQMTDREVDGTGAETGRFWESGGQRFGWTGEAFQKMKRLSERIAKSNELRGLVSEAFILDQVFMWLCETLDRKRSDSICDFILQRCDEALGDHELYVPLWRTYSSTNFVIGDVEFKSITKELLDQWFSRKPKDDPEMMRRVQQLENDTRARFQATLAACVKVQAEAKKASQLALEKALTATALLRFLSPANWTCKIRSYTLPIGMENCAIWHSFHLEKGAITSRSSNVVDGGPDAWVIDRSTAELSGVVEALSDLAESQQTEFRKTLYDAMLIYSRNSTTTEAADKLLFVLVALESVLLKDSNEPIQGNLADRMAFLIGKSLDERKDIVAVVKKVYATRSKFIHHGQTINDVTVLDKFLIYAWTSFLKLLGLRDQFKTRSELLVKLDEVKLS